MSFLAISSIEAAEIPRVAFRLEEWSWTASFCVQGRELEGAKPLDGKGTRKQDKV